MNLTLFTPSQNCCPIEICHESCLMMGNLTLFGWLVVVLIVLFSMIGFSLYMFFKPCNCKYCRGVA